MLTMNSMLKMTAPFKNWQATTEEAFRRSLLSNQKKKYDILHGFLNIAFRCGFKIEDWDFIAYVLIIFVMD